MFKSLLDNPKEYSNFDTKDVYASLRNLSRQFESGWHEAIFATLPIDQEKIKNLLIVGMGGSILAGKIIKSLSPLFLNIPFENVSNYRLPNHVDKSSLIILTSYSGKTEEVMSCALDAKKRGAKVIVITTGDELEKVAKTNLWPVIKLDSETNISKVPRYGLMLLLGATLGLVHRLNPKVPFDAKQQTDLIQKISENLSRERNQEFNPAKQLATSHQRHALVFISANHLTGVADSAKNMINESAKTFSASFEIPDLNHHFLDGLVFPEDLKDKLKFIILNSSYYPEAISNRIKLTQEILIKQKYQVSVIKPETPSIVGETIESLVFFSYFSYYLSITSRVDPGTNPWVDYLKNKL